jgi:sugar O-acyltransferase (sialic acid O-acetyltransferase NeuD family)
MTNLQKLIVVGAGGFGPEIIWAAENMNGRFPRFDILGYCDDSAEKKGRNLYGYRVLGTPEEADRHWEVKPGFVCAIGNNLQRSKVVERVLKLGWQPVTIVDPSVVVAKTVRIGRGTYVGAGSVLSPQAQLGDHVIINHCCSIGHDSKLESFVQISPGGRVSGGCVLMNGAMLGSNAVLAPYVKVGANATVGAGSFALMEVPAGATVIGNPARVVVRGPEKR